jgi:hypothetical protein
MRRGLNIETHGLVVPRLLITKLELDGRCVTQCMILLRQG